MNDLVESILNKIQFEVELAREESIKEKVTSQKEIEALFTKRIPRVISNNIFKSVYTINSRNFTVVATKDVLYFKPKGLSICALIEIPKGDKELREVIGTIFAKNNPKYKFGKKTLKGDIALFLINEAIKKLSPGLFDTIELFRLGGI